MGGLGKVQKALLEALNEQGAVWLEDFAEQMGTEYGSVLQAIRGLWMRGYENIKLFKLTRSNGARHRKSVFKYPYCKRRRIVYTDEEVLRQLLEESLRPGVDKRILTWFRVR